MKRLGEMEMFVCKECHERDRIATGCGESHKSHIVNIMGKCAACGKKSLNLRWCFAYRSLKKSDVRKKNAKEI